MATRPLSPSPTPFLACQTTILQPPAALTLVLSLSLSLAPRLTSLSLYTLFSQSLPCSRSLVRVSRRSLAILCQRCISICGRVCVRVRVQVEIG